jgi:putative ABC transport system permease protein
MLFRESPTDPLVFIGVPLAFAAVSLVASWLPARRAASVDPMIALRDE